MVVLSLTGCAPRYYDPGERLVNQESVGEYLFAVQGVYPRNCRLTQRVLVHFRGGEFDMIGYLFLRPEGEWSAVALGDMGIELFHLRWTNGQGEVIRQPESMPPGPIRDGVIADIQHLFGRKHAHPAYLTQQARGRVGLVLQISQDVLEVYDFVGRGKELAGSRTIADGVIVREATFEGAAMYSGAADPLSKRIVLHNYEWGYSMEVEPLSVELADQPQHTSED
ncbi:MAG: DUF3261 domain-containing protein [Phycisphaerales bacterium]|nr:MAG: DUF3261 domain-containing protein [Phycisphaerales bacterium]